MKRFLSMILAMTLLAVLFLPLAAADEENNSTGVGYYYVYTENGLGLNVRDEPSFRGNKVGEIRYGTRIHVKSFTDENWALILFRYDKPGYGTGEYPAWVYRRFLTKNAPSAKPTTAPQPETTGDAWEDLNKEFASAKNVEDYIAIVRPARVSGFVTMRWAPSLSAEIQATYKANDRLLVIAETDYWLQVEDQDTGAVGFIQKAFIMQ